jgi:hypothetical protein
MRSEVDRLAGQLLVEAATPAPAPEPSAPETSGV